MKSYAGLLLTPFKGKIKVHVYIIICTPYSATLSYSPKVNVEGEYFR